MGTQLNNKWNDLMHMSNHPLTGESQNAFWQAWILKREIESLLLFHHGKLMRYDNIVWRHTPLLFFSRSVRRTCLAPFVFFDMSDRDASEDVSPWCVRRWRDRWSSRHGLIIATRFQVGERFYLVLCMNSFSLWLEIRLKSHLKEKPLSVCIKMGCVYLFIWIPISCYFCNRYSSWGPY